MHTFFKVIATLALSILLSVTHSQQNDLSLIPSNLPIITENNIDQVREIVSIGNGGVGHLHWSANGKMLAMNNAYGIWLYDLQHLEDEPSFLPEPDLDFVHFSEDGLQIIAWSSRNNPNTPARLWDIRTTEQIMNWSVDDFSDVQWRFQTDSIITGPMADRKHQIRFWDILTGAEFYRYQGNPNNLYLSADRSIGALKSRNSLTFDVATGEPIWIHYEGHPDPYPPSSFQQISSSGEFLLMSNNEGDLTIHQTANGQAIRTLQTPDGMTYTFFYFTLDDRYVIGHSRQNNLIQIWNTQTGDRLNTITLNGEITSDKHIEVSPITNHILMVASPQLGYITFYSIQTGQEIGTIVIGEELFDYAYSPDQCCLATMTMQGFIQIWNIHSGEELFRSERYEDIGDVVAISPDGKLLITINPNRSQRTAVLKIWDIYTGQTIKELEQANLTYPIVKFSPNGSEFATNASGPYSMEWDGWMWESIRLRDALDVTYSPDSQYLVIAGGTYNVSSGLVPPVFQTLSIYDTQINRDIISIPEPVANGGGFLATAFSADGKYLVAATGYHIFIWEFAKLLEQDFSPITILDSSETVGDLVFSPDGSKLVAGQALLRFSGEGFINFNGNCSAVAWNFNEVLEQTDSSQNDLTPAECYFTPPFSGPGRFVDFSPNGELILVYGDDISWEAWITPMTLFDTQTGNVLRQFWEQDSFVMSPDGTFMISEGIDKRLHYWAVPTEEN